MQEPDDNPTFFRRTGGILTRRRSFATARRIQQFCSLASASKYRRLDQGESALAIADLQSRQLALHDDGAFLAPTTPSSPSAAARAWLPVGFARRLGAIQLIGAHSCKTVSAHPASISRHAALRDVTACGAGGCSISALTSSGRQIEGTAMAPLVLLVALTAFAPTTSFDSICQSARVSSLPGEEESAFQACIRDERAARDELQKRWGSFTGDMREACAESAKLTFSYVELLTCLEMQPGSNLSDFPVTRLEPLTPHER